MKRALFPVLIGLAIAPASCAFTPEGSLIRDAVKAKGAQAYDEGLANAKWFICEAASVGSIRREFGRDQKSAQTYNDLCAPAVPPSLIAP